MVAAARATAVAARATYIHCTGERPGAAGRTRGERPRAPQHGASPWPREAPRSAGLLPAGMPP
eukprot:scaffold100723_cov33-Phaeocystis_antarctica.AAC.1